MPPYSSGIVTPKSPSSFICSTTASGNESSWSCSSATGRTSLSTNCRTISVMAFCSSVLSVKAVVATAMGPQVTYGRAGGASGGVCQTRVVEGVRTQWRRLRGLPRTWPKAAWRVRGYGDIPLVGRRVRFYDIDRWPYDQWALAARKGQWEPRTLARFAELVHPGDTVVDVGAHFGIYALLASRLVGAHGRVIAFEPDPVSRAQLVRNIEGARAGNVDVRAEAVSDSAGKGRLGAESLGVGSSTLGHDGIEVETVTLAGCCGRHGVAPDVLKIDVEGGEAAVLAGASTELLANLRAAVVEIHDDMLERRGIDPQAWLARTAGAFARLEPLDKREP